MADKSKTEPVKDVVKSTNIKKEELSSLISVIRRVLESLETKLRSVDDTTNEIPFTDENMAKILEIIDSAIVTEESVEKPSTEANVDAQVADVDAQKTDVDERREPAGSENTEGEGGVEAGEAEGENVEQGGEETDEAEEAARRAAEAARRAAEAGAASEGEGEGGVEAGAASEGEGAASGANKQGGPSNLDFSNPNAVSKHLNENPGELSSYLDSNEFKSLSDEQKNEIRNKLNLNIPSINSVYRETNDYKTEISDEEKKRIRNLMREAKIDPTGRAEESSGGKKKKLKLKKGKKSNSRKRSKKNKKGTKKKY